MSSGTTFDAAILIVLHRNFFLEAHKHELLVDFAEERVHDMLRRSEKSAGETFFGIIVTNSDFQWIGQRYV